MTTLGRAGQAARAPLPMVAPVADVGAGKRALAHAMTDLEAICAEANTLVDRLTIGLRLLEETPESERYWAMRDHWGRLRTKLRYLAYDESEPWTGELVYAGAWRRGLAVLTTYLALPPEAQRAAEQYYGPFLGLRGEYHFFVVRWPKARVEGLDGMTPGWLRRVG
jgi:hypothetical protein